MKSKVIKNAGLVIGTSNLIFADKGFSSSSGKPKEEEKKDKGIEKIKETLKNYTQNESFGRLDDFIKNLVKNIYSKSEDHRDKKVDYYIKDSVTKNDLKDAFTVGRIKFNKKNTKLLFICLPGESPRIRVYEGENYEAEKTKGIQDYLGNKDKLNIFVAIEIETNENGVVKDVDLIKCTNDTESNELKKKYPLKGKEKDDNKDNRNKEKENKKRILKENMIKEVNSDYKHATKEMIDFCKSFSILSNVIKNGKWYNIEIDKNKKLDSMDLSKYYYSDALDMFCKSFYKVFYNRLKIEEFYNDSVLMNDQKLIKIKEFIGYFYEYVEKLVEYCLNDEKNKNTLKNILLNFGNSDEFLKKLKEYPNLDDYKTYLREKEKKEKEYKEQKDKEQKEKEQKDKEQKDKEQKEKKVIEDFEKLNVEDIKNIVEIFCILNDDINGNRWINIDLGNGENILSLEKKDEFKYYDKAITALWKYFYHVFGQTLKLKEFTNLENFDDAKKLSIIKDYIKNNYDYLENLFNLYFSKKPFEVKDNYSCASEEEFFDILKKYPGLDDFKNYQKVLKNKEKK